jgi:site-specific DNA recombinase
VSALSGAPYGYRYIGRHEGGGIARFEQCEDEARIVRSIFRWVGVDRVSLRAVSRRLGPLRIDEGNRGAFAHLGFV